MLLVSEAFQVRVNLRDLRVGNLRARKRGHQPDTLAHDRDELCQILLERYQRWPLTTARTGPMARFADPCEDGLAGITLVRACARHENGADEGNGESPHCHAILNAS
jgi:hypothetical protein